MCCGRSWGGPGSATSSHTLHTHYIAFRLVVGGKKTEIRTRLSHGAHEYGSSLLAEMAKQMGLRRVELNSFLECPMDHESYVRPLIERDKLRVL